MATSIKAKAHTQYRLADGTRVKGVTTIIAENTPKDALIEWAYQQGLAGKDYKKARDQAGDIGSLVHYMILCHFKNEKPDTSDYSKNEIDSAENSMISFYTWLDKYKIEPVIELIEQPLISEQWRYGGTPDLPAYVDNEPEIIDFKSGKGIYPNEHIPQLGGYWQLLTENGWACSKGRIVNIPKKEDDKFDELILSPKLLDIGWQIFEHQLTICNLKKQLKGEK